MSFDYSEIKDLFLNNQLPSHDELFSLAEKACDVLENEKTDYRPQSVLEQSGSLLDFRNSSLPLLVVPDIHARPDFVKNILCYELSADFLGTDKSCTVYEALEQKKLNVVCVGDALHTEYSTKNRWLDIQKEFDDGIYTGNAIIEEMTDGLSVISALMKLKLKFIENFHFLKGNHENILNRCGDGDFAFRKYADEGYMVRKFVIEYYGEDVLYILSCVENVLPLIFVDSNCVVSHAEPKKVYSRDELINAKKYPKIVESLTWTDNHSAEDGSVLGIIQNLSDSNGIDDYVYLGGHRPVGDNFLLRQNGLYVQIHNPAKQNVALVRKDRKFDPFLDIVSVI